jgi:hypothetical protein
MVASRHVVRALLLAVALSLSALLGACGRKAGPSPEPAPAPLTSPVASNTQPPPSTTEASPSASSGFPAPTVYRAGAHCRILRAVQGRTDFEFLRTACVSPIDRFVTAKNADIDTVIASARQFFKGKRGVAYTPRVEELRIEHNGTVTVARLPLKMVWGIPPREVMTQIEWPDDTVAGPDPNEVGPLWAQLVEHKVTVDVEVAFDAAGRITRYVEGSPHQNRLRATGGESCSEKRFDPGVGVKALAKGTIVTDLGDSYMTNLSVKGPDVIRRVRLPGGQDGWVNDALSWEVASPGGTSASGCRPSTRRSVGHSRFPFRLTLDARGNGNGNPCSRDEGGRDSRFIRPCAPTPTRPNPSRRPTFLGFEPAPDYNVAPCTVCFSGACRAHTKRPWDDLPCRMRAGTPAARSASSRQVDDKLEDASASHLRRELRGGLNPRSIERS